MKKLLISALLACAPCLGFAGSPDGLQLVVLGTSQAVVAQAKIAQYFAEYEKSEGNFDCDDSMLSIGSAMQKPVSAITSEKALNSVTDKKQRLEFSKALASYRDARHGRGFDGALLYDIQDDTLKIYGISAWSKEKIHRSELKPSDWNNKTKFRLAMCRAIVGMPVLQSP